MEGDNFQCRLECRSIEYAEKIFKIIFDAKAPGGKAVGYFVYDRPRKGWDASKPAKSLVLVWSKSDSDDEVSDLPYVMDADAAWDFCKNWLRTAEYPPEPDQDGSNEEGVYLSSGDYWGHVNDDHYAILEISPEWAMFGK